MKCPSCGIETPAESAFCPKCGGQLSDEGGGQANSSNVERFMDSAKSRQGDDDNEDDIWQGGYSAKAMYGTWMLGGFITVGLIVAMFFFWPAAVPLALAIIVLWIILASRYFYRKFSVHYEMTSQRFIHKSGILKRVTDRIEMIDIDDVTFEQGIIQRLLDVGTIRISSSDRTHPELMIAGIADVKSVAEAIDDYRRKERRRRGLHIESI